jgi:hypothetical protein
MELFKNITPVRPCQVEEKSCLPASFDSGKPEMKAGNSKVEME